MKKKIGILLLSNGWAGTEILVYNLLKFIRKKKVELNLFVNDEIFNYYRNIKEIKTYNLGRLYPRSTAKKIMRFFFIRKKLKEILLNKKIDLVCLFLVDSIIVYMSIQKKVKIPFLVTLQGTEIKDYAHEKINLKSIIKRKYLNEAFNKSSAITALSNWQINLLNKKHHKKSFLLPLGTDNKTFRPLKIKKERNVILFVGRFIEIKGIRELVGVAKQLPLYEFWFAGKGTLENLIKGENIKNLGFKNSKELVRLYNRATICVFPSHYEGFGNVGLEAMSCEKAIIATPLGFSEYLENEKEGIIIPAKNERALKEAIVRLMKNQKLREKLGKNARKKALKYSWDKVAGQYEKLFDEIVKKQ